MKFDLEQELRDAHAYIALHREVKEFALIGSAAYMPEQANDVDFALLIDADVPTFASEMGGFERCGDYDQGYIDGQWTAMRRGNLNLMITADVDWYRKYIQAMQVCKYLKIADKIDRIAVCKIVRDGFDADQVAFWVQMGRDKDETDAEIDRVLGIKKPATEQDEIAQAEMQRLFDDKNKTHEDEL